MLFVNLLFQLIDSSVVNDRFLSHSHYLKIEVSEKKTDVFF